MGLAPEYGYNAQSSSRTGPTIAYRSEPWYAAYMAALFEAEKREIPERIRSAEQMMMAREQALAQTQSGFAERRALQNALHALRALQACIKP